MRSVEQRSTPLLAGALFNDQPTGSGRRIVSGVGLPYNEWADIGSFLERFTSDAFSHDEAAGWPNVQLRFAHIPELMLASTAANTLQITNDASGLHYRAELPRSSYIEDLVERGDVAGASISFYELQGEWDMGSDEIADLPRRTVSSALLTEISLVARPAYTGTSAALTRSAPALHRHVEAVEVYDDEADEQLYSKSILLPSGETAVLSVDGPLRTLELPDGRKVQMMDGSPTRTASPPRRAVPTFVEAPMVVTAPRRQRPRQILVTPHEPMTLSDASREMDKREAGWRAIKNRELAFEHYRQQGVANRRAIAGIR